jgi:FtsP/CotA-like multicopper oxidase with cupredoxin domain
MTEPTLTEPAGTEPAVIRPSSPRSSRMNRATNRRLTGFASAALAGAAMLVVAVPSAPTQAAAPGDEGISCAADLATNGAGPTFELDATTGYISTPDGNSIFMWSYAPYTATGVPGAFQLPGPTLCVTQDQQVTVTVHNKLVERTSVLFPGQLDVKANGVPAQPESTNGVITSLTSSAPAKTGTITYTFTAGDPGTYLYSSGTDVTKQRQMGLYGGLVVRSATVGQANGQAWSAFKPDQEYLYLLSDLDPDLHLAVERNRNYNFAAIKARYFLINGRSMPDTLAPNHAAWLPAQPYGALVHIQPKSAANPKPALIRYLNAGSVNYPFHPHGSNQTVITRDGVPTQDSSRTGEASYEKFLIDVAPGQSIDTLEAFSTEYDPMANPIPNDIQLPQLQDQIVGPGTETWFSENPYLGGTLNPLPNGIIQNNQCGEYYHVAHSHALEQATNFGASFGGMMTLIRIDPPTGCPQ